MALNAFEDALNDLAEDAQAQASDPFEQALREVAAEETQRSQARLRVATKVGSETMPDRAANAAAWGKRYGLPASFVERTYDKVKARAEADDRLELTKTSPKTADWLTNPNNNALSKDDVPSLTGFERVLGVGRALAGNVGGTLKGGTASGLGALWGGVQEAAELVGAERLAEYARGGVMAGEQVSGRAKPSAQDLQTPTPGGVGRSAYHLGLARFIEEQVYAGLESVGFMAPALAVGAAAGPLAGAGMIGVAASGRAYTQARGQGVGVAKSAAFAGFQSAVEVATEYIPMRRLFGDLAAKSGLIQTLAHQLKPEIASEQIATVFQDMAEYAALPANKDKTWVDYAKERPSAAAATLISTIVAVGATTTAAHATVTLAEKVGVLAQNSKTIERSPEAAADLITQQTKDTPAEIAYLPIEAFTTYYQNQGQNPAEVAAKLTGDPQAFQQAKDAGTDLAVPMASYITQIAKDEAASAFFVKEMRLDPTQMNGREADEFSKAIESVATEQEQAEPVTVSAPSAITNIFTDRLIAAGRPVLEARATGAAAGAFFDIYLGQRLGLDPAAILERRGVDVSFNPLGRPVEEGVTTLEQRYESDFAGGAMNILKDGRLSIELFRTANASTALHEFGHVFLELLREAAPQSTQATADLKLLTDWFGTEDITTPQHEQFARGLEQYGREGKPPSRALRAVFARFARWFRRIYQSAADLDVTLSPDVRALFDRFFATDDAIAEVEAEYNLKGTFTTPEQAGMTAEGFAKYQDQIAEASAAAREELIQRVMKEEAREHTAEWKATKATIRAAVTAEFQALPVYRARAAQRGEGPTPMKGQPLEVVAEMFGFSSADELSQANAVAPSMPKAIAAEVNRRMTEQFGDPLSLERLRAQAVEIVHGERRAEIVRVELAALTKGMQQKAIPKPAQLKAYAERRIAETRIRDLRPGQYLMSAQRASKQAFDLQGSNRVAAIQAKQQELVSLALYREALRVKEEADKAHTYMRSFEKPAVQARIGKAEGGYLEQILGYVDRFEFAQVTNKALDKRAKLAAWIASVKADGLPIDLPESVTNDAELVNWRELTTEQLFGVRDAVKQIEHLARLKNKLLASKDQRELSEIVASVATRILTSLRDKRPPARLTRSRSMLDKVKRWGSDVAISTLNVDTIVRELDGWTDLGPVYEHVKGGIDRAIVERLMPRTKEAAAALEKINGVYKRGELQKRVYIPALRDSLTKEEILSVALNQGSLENRAAFLDSKLSEQVGVTEPVVAAILGTLEKRDWDYAQSVWDYLETYWPEIEASQKRRKGIAPPKVEAAPVQTKFGTYRGGYYTLKYDQEGSILATQDQIDDAIERMRVGRFASAHTRAGFAIERQGSGGRPVLLSLGVIQQHVTEVLYDLTVGDAIRDADRVLRHKGTREAFEAMGQRDAYQALTLWLHDVASGEIIASDGFSRTLRWLRVGHTVSSLALNIGTMAIQPSGIAQTAVVIGKRATMRGLVDLTTRKWFGEGNVFQQVTEASPFMATRQTTFNKDIMTAMENVKDSRIPAWVPQAYFYGITKSQWLVDVTTWLGAHSKGLRQFDGDTEKATAFADRMVARAQASGLWSDRTAIERGTMNAQTRQSEGWRMWTSLISYALAKWNVAYEKTRRAEFKKPAQAIGWAVDMFMLFAVEALFAAWLRGKFKDDDDEPFLMTWARETTFNVMSSLPFVREIGSAIEGFPAGGVVGTLAQRTKNVYTQVSQGEFDMALVRALNSLGGMLFHYPSGQTNRLLEASERANEGQDVPLIDYLIYQEK